MIAWPGCYGGAKQRIRWEGPAGFQLSRHRLSGFLFLLLIGGFLRLDGLLPFGSFLGSLFSAFGIILFAFSNNGRNVKTELGLFDFRLIRRFSVPEFG